MSEMQKLSAFKAEPAAIYGLINSAVLCAVAFGLSWNGDQIAAIMLLTNAILTVFIRQSVTPNFRATIPPDFSSAPVAPVTPRR